MISLESGTIQKVYNLEEEEEVVVFKCFKNLELFFSLRKKPRLTVTQNRWTKLCIFSTLF
jgi:hypothetical protein